MMEHIDKIGSMALVAVLFLVVHEWFRMRSSVDKNKAYSKAWHIMSWFVRLMITGIIHQAYFNWWITSAAIVFFFPVWNLVCANALRQKWNYLSDHGIDAIIKTIIKSFKR